MILRPLILICCLLIPLTDAARADDRLDEAIAAYLADDDAAALPVLAELAAGGDVKARLLLGRIATRPFSPWVAALKRKDRNALLRAPGGLSGKSWMTVVAKEGDPLAAAFEGVKGPGYDLNAIRSLMDAGEVDAAAAAMAANLSREPVGDPSILMEHPNASPDIRHLIMFTREARPNLPRPEQTELDRVLERGTLARTLYDLFGDRRRYERKGDAALMNDDELGALYRLGGFVNEMLESDHEMTGALLQGAGTTTASLLKVYCARACPDEALRCMADAVTLAGGYHALWDLGSPLRSVIPEATYQSSPRMHADVARAMQARLRIWTAQQQAEITARSCAAASRLRTRFD